LGNHLGKRIIFSKDFFLGKNCTLGDDVRVGRAVRLGSDISIGADTFIENIEIDDHSMLETKVVCTGYGKGKIKIGKHCYVGIGNVLDWSNDITIGDYVHIAGPSTGIWTHTSAPMCLNSIPLEQKGEQFRPTAPIIIEDNVYIGGNCTLYPGIHIGHHSIVAPNSAVTKDVPPYTMVGGVPAHEIKKIQLSSAT
jgi:acetyltransferase-like isoleucine patch superfamily enzyme